MKVPFSFGFYAILTDPVVGYERLAGLLVSYCIPFIQLRMKEAPPDLVRQTAISLKKITQGTKSRLIINDYPKIAAETGADGVHIGQDDMPYSRAREIVGQDAIIGISTHNPVQTQKACALKPDYIGIGPVFATTTKKIPDPPLGIPLMKKMLGLATVPSVALGSVTTENLSELLAAGVRNFSLVRPLNRSAEPENVLKEIQKIHCNFMEK